MKHDKDWNGCYVAWRKYLNINFQILLNIVCSLFVELLVTWPSGIARKLQILRDGFDSRLEPIAFDI